METLCLLIENYETKHYPKPDISGNDILEIGPIDDVSKIIKGQQALKTQQIRALSERFHVSRDVFFL